MKVESITTPDFEHSKLCSLVEIILLIQEGPLQLYPWRQDKSDPTLRLHKLWATTIKVVRRIIKARKLNEEEMLYFAIRKPELFTWKKIGLLFWHIDNKPFHMERFSEVISNLINTHRLEVKNNVKIVHRKIKSTKDLLKRKNNG